ncbi:sugar transferase [Lactobacillus gallinarum]|uniref:sugar transferase n=1 Tax=Lactobacillus gallinarum TaxID=52242 RepID=UPI0025A47197|nr:sugar transferase [Lactobacillus gallinarum]MDM8276950.1 sugar transferase [Lactobacillus gallinarum]
MEKVARHQYMDYKFEDHIGQPIPLSRLWLKRVIDIVLALIGMIILAIATIIFAPIIKLTSPGPVFYSQKRVGYMGRPITIRKFRSMRNDAEKKTGAVWAQKDDPRVTPIGKFMRKTRIDELPQFWNILVGDMSLVGPRPERPQLTEEFYEEWPEFPERLRTIPGLTGWAQINGGYDISPEEKCHLDNYYIDHWSIWFDIKIMLGTVEIIFTGNGAR